MAFDYTACQCDSLRYSTYVDAARQLVDQVKIARTFGAAAGIIFRATHPDIQTEPAEISTRSRCQTCMPHIGRAIVEAGVRPQAEFDVWQRRLAEARGDSCTNCGDCGKTGKCKVTFDLSPL